MSDPVKNHTHAHAAEPVAAPDAAGQSLQNALHLSFRILTGVIILLLALFLSQGFFRVKQNETALVLRFGQASPARVMAPGPHFGFPPPIERVVRFPNSSQLVRVNTFWPRGGKDVVEAAKEGEAQGEAAVAGAEGGYVLTGDQNVIECQWTVEYSIGAGADDLINFYTNVGSIENANRLVRSVVQNAIIRQCSRIPIGQVVPQSADFTRGVSETVLSTFTDGYLAFTGIRIRAQDQGDSVKLVAVQVPATVKPAFDMVLMANSQANQAITDASKEKDMMLIAAAGEAGRDLEEKIAAWWVAKSVLIAATAPDSKITSEQVAKAEADLAKSEAEIHAILSDTNRQGGRVASILAQANSYAERIKSESVADSEMIKRFESSSPAALASYMDRMRVAAIQELLTGCTEKFMISGNISGENFLTIDWDRRPEIRGRKAQPKPLDQ